MSALGKEFKRRSRVLLDAVSAMGEKADGSQNKKVLYSAVIILALAICGMILSGCSGKSEQPTKKAVTHAQKFKGSDVALNSGESFNVANREQYFYEMKNPGEYAEAWSHLEFSDGWDDAEYVQQRSEWMTTQVPERYEQLLRARGLVGREADSARLISSSTTDVWIDAEIAKNDPTAQPWVAKLYGADNMHLVRVMTGVDLGTENFAGEVKVQGQGQIDLEAIVHCPAGDGCRIVSSTYAVINDGYGPTNEQQRTRLFSQILTEWKN